MSKKDKKKLEATNESNALKEAESATPSFYESQPIKMPTPQFMKRRKKRQGLMIATAIALAGVTVLSVLSFLGDRFGNFTVSLDAKARAQLSLGSSLQVYGGHADIRDSTSYLNADGFTATTTIFADAFYDDKYGYGGDEVIDCELTEADAPEKKKASPGFGAAYWAYTFYLKNQAGGAVSHFSCGLVSTSNIDPDNISKSVSLKKMIRVRLYQNTYLDDGTITHSSTTYAWRRDTPNELGDYREYIQDPNVMGYNAQYPQNEGYADRFLEEPATGNFQVFGIEGYLGVGEIRRYTVLFWFEGADMDTVTAEEPPEGGQLTFSMNFSGLEASDDEE